MAPGRRLLPALGPAPSLLLALPMSHRVGHKWWRGGGEKGGHTGAWLCQFPKRPRSSTAPKAHREPQLSRRRSRPPSSARRPLSPRTNAPRSPSTTGTYQQSTSRPASRSSSRRRKKVLPSRSHGSTAPRAGSKSMGRQTAPLPRSLAPHRLRSPAQKSRSPSPRVTGTRQGALSSISCGQVRAQQQPLA